ncbi:MAG: DNA integrity scanning protein DisA nucleotide-binding domain protein, partial [Oscillospiraceae bacterium]|nr:DNA integrity scanning protein DisA nucleotide-binding domain protein [Oscillospiraceae bacterium]
DLGMRHRAGIGMSENSDAVVVIVSEETGTISVAVGGLLKRHLKPETLEKLLVNELIPVEEGKDEKQKFHLPSLKRTKKEKEDTDGAE